MTEQPTLPLAFPSDDPAPFWTPELPPEIVQRLARLSICCVAVRWSTYWQEWLYDLQRTHGQRWTYRADPTAIITKTAAGVMATAQAIETKEAL